MLKWTAVAVTLVMMLGGGQAVAVETVEVGPHLEVREDRPYMWVDGMIGDLDSDWLRIVLSAPRADGRRRVWQRCEFAYEGAGRYSCGFRIGRGTDASRLAGEWAARLVSDDGRLDRILFWVPAS